MSLRLRYCKYLDKKIFKIETRIDKLRKWIRDDKNRIRYLQKLLNKNYKELSETDKISYMMECGNDKI